MTENTKTPVAVLQELAVKKGVAPPDYKVVTEKSGTHDNSFEFVVTVAGVEANGSGSSKKIARHQAAHNALKKLQENGIYNPVSEVKIPVKYSDVKSAPNNMSNLQNLCMKNKIPNPQYTEIASEGPSHAPAFTFECKISSVVTTAKAKSKKMAKQLAAEIMLQKINDVLPDVIAAESEKFTKLVSLTVEAVTKGDLNEEDDKTRDSLVKLMKAQNLTYENFAKDLTDVTEDSMKRISEKLNISFEILPFQEKPPMAALYLKSDPPLVKVGIGSTYEEAVQNALKLVFTRMDNFMKIQE